MLWKVFFTVGFLTLAASAATPDRIQRAEAAAAENLKSEAGRKYADSASSAASKPLAAALKACRDSLAGGLAKTPGAQDTGATEVYLMLNRQGRLKDMVAGPQPGFGDCLARKARGDLALPPPPGPNYWIRVRVPAATGPAGR